MNKKYCIFGTAGHIDHGKSSLVKKITGTDPDRLKEEKKRGITIDLGFAFLEEQNYQIAFVDVPGHEKLVKNMIAGATGFDACLFAVDAKEGIMPQTIEHTNIIKSLEINDIIVAITKSDLLNQDELQENIKKIKDFFNSFGFKNIQFISVSIFNDKSIENLKNLILKIAEELKTKNVDLPFMMRIDRSFSLKGFGTIITGTAISGKVFIGQQLTLLPQNKKLKVKSINVNSKNEKTAFASQRVALNIANIDKQDIHRGNILTENNNLLFTNKLFVKITVFDLKKEISIKHNKNYPLFIGTAHYNCKIIFLDKREIKNNESAYAIIKLPEKYAPFIKENFLIRSLSPQLTIASGKVLSVFDFNLDKKSILKALSLIDNNKYNNFIDLILEQNINGLLIPSDIQFLPLYNIEELFKQKDIYYFNGVIISNKQLEKIIDNSVESLKNNNQFDLNSLQKYNFNEAIRKIIENKIVKFALSIGYIQQGHLIKKNIKSEFEILCDKILNTMKEDISLSNQALIAEKFNLNTKVAENCIKHLSNRNLIVQIDNRVWVNKELLEKLLSDIKNLALKNNFVDLKSIKQIINAPRKILVPLMDYLDSTGLYINKDNKRFLKK